MTLAVNIPENMLNALIQYTGNQNLVEIEKIISSKIQLMLWEDIRKKYNKNVTPEEFRDVLREVAASNEPIEEDRK